MPAATTHDAGYLIEQTGMTFTRELRQSEWDAVGRILGRYHNRTLWALGDWLVFGGRQGLGGRWIGSSYRRAAEITGLSASWLCMVHNVAKHFPRTVRQLEIPWTAYRAVLQRPDAFALLDQYLANHWTTRELVNRIDATAASVPLRVPRPVKRVYVYVRVRCPRCEYEFPIHGHKIKGARHG